MPIEFRCTHCGRLLRTREDAAGRQAKCPECGTTLDVPSSSAPEEVRGAPPAETGAFPPDSAGASPFGAGVPPPSGTASPFGPDVSPSAGAPGPENPYESPRGVEAGGAGPAYPIYSELHAYASSRVSGPAVGLIVTGALGLTLQILGTVANLIALAMPGMMPGMPGPGPGPQMFMFPGGVQLFFNLLGIGLAILVIVGAQKMKNLQSYSLAMTSAIIALVPFISPCCCLGLPFGIWALVVLSDSQVQAAFRTQASPSSF